MASHCRGQGTCWCGCFQRLPSTLRQLPRILQQLSKILHQLPNRSPASSISIPAHPTAHPSSSPALGFGSLPLPLPLPDSGSKCTSCHKSYPIFFIWDAILNATSRFQSVVSPLGESLSPPEESLGLAQLLYQDGT